MRKILLIVLAVVVVVIIIVGILKLTGNKIPGLGGEKVSVTKINTSPLGSDKEKSIGTILYAGQDKASEVKTSTDGKLVTFKTTDSVDGVIGIYSQDLASRYPNYTVTKDVIKKNDSINKKATVLTCKGKSGKITVTAWGGSDGMTNVEILTSADFK